MNDIGNRIKSLRENAGYSQLQLAKMIGKTQGTIKDIENGKNLLTKMENVLKIMDIFNISFEYIFADNYISNTEIDDTLTNEIDVELSNMSYTDIKLTYRLLQNFLDFKNT